MVRIFLIYDQVDHTIYMVKAETADKAFMIYRDIVLPNEICQYDDDIAGELIEDLSIFEITTEVAAFLASKDLYIHVTPELET